jgi:hypothetical protein
LHGIEHQQCGVDELHQLTAALRRKALDCRTGRPMTTAMARMVDCPSFNAL